jgi:hypothetical protein
MIDAFATPQPAQKDIFFILPVVRNQSGNRGSDNLVGAVAENALGSGIPAPHDPVQIPPDNRVKG